MRKLFTPITLTVLMIAIAVALAFGFAPAGAQAQPATPSADTILTQALQASAGATNGSGTFEISATVNADTSGTSSNIQGILGQPMGLSGTYSFDAKQSALQSTMNLLIANQTIPVGLEVIGAQAWVQFMGQWYDLPVGMMGNGWMSGGDGQGMMGSGTTDTSGTTGTTDGTGSMGGWLNQADISSFLQALTNSNIDPSTWISGLNVVGNDTINGSQTYHVNGTLDLNKILTDLIGSTQDQSLQSIQQTVNAWVKNLSVDMWVDTTTNQFRQFQANASIMPPTGQGDGINSITAKLTVTMDQTVTGQTFNAPSNTKPFSDLQSTINGIMNLFGVGSGSDANGATPGSTGTTSTTGATGQ